MKYQPYINFTYRYFSIKSIANRERKIALSALNASVPVTRDRTQPEYRSPSQSTQLLYSADNHAVELLSRSNLRYPHPTEVESSTLLRLVRFSDPLTSPLTRVIRNSFVGIRAGDARWMFLVAASFSSIAFYLAKWQLDRAEWKAALIERRTKQLSKKEVLVKNGPFPWLDSNDDWEYRRVELHGVFDHAREQYVGPRPYSEPTGATAAGYLVITPLILDDGSVILINRGLIHVDKACYYSRKEVPRKVVIHGVLHKGEDRISSLQPLTPGMSEDNTHRFLLVEDLAPASGSSDMKSTGEMLVTCSYWFYEDETKVDPKTREILKTERKNTSLVGKPAASFLQFWADDRTHKLYALQWIAMGLLPVVWFINRSLRSWRWRF